MALLSKLIAYEISEELLVQRIEQTTNVRERSFN